jgi:hypothetical protein
VGEHTTEVLIELGLTAEEIDVLTVRRAGLMESPEG